MQLWRDHTRNTQLEDCLGNGVLERRLLKQRLMAWKHWQHVTLSACVADQNMQRIMFARLFEAWGLWQRSNELRHRQTKLLMLGVICSTNHACASALGGWRVSTQLSMRRRISIQESLTQGWKCWVYEALPHRQESELRAMFHFGRTKMPRVCSKVSYTMIGLNCSLVCLWIFS